MAAFDLVAHSLVVSKLSSTPNVVLQTLSISEIPSSVKLPVPLTPIDPQANFAGAALT